MLAKKILLWTAIVCLTQTACSKKNPTAHMTSREHFEYAMKFYTKKDYVKAQDEFSVITYKFSGSDVADDAQYYLADSYFKQKDYISASSEFDRLVASYPRSEFVEKAVYQLVISYDKLSPAFPLDQKYTYEALRAIQNFLDLYPTSEHRPEVDKILSTINDKLARKHFESAQIYRKISEYDAAIVYYDQVITDYYNTRYARESKYWKGYCYYKLEEYQKASLILNKFVTDYPAETELVKDSQELLKKIKEKEAKIRAKEEKELKKKATSDSETQS